MDSSSNQSYPTIKDFVLQEAHEKAFQTLVFGLKDYEKQKSRLFNEKKESIHSEYDKRVKDNNSSKRIHRSALINGSRMTKMQKRHHYLTSIVHESEHQILNKVVGNETQYKQILKNLIIEGLIKMLEPKVYIRCLKRDHSIIQTLVSECKSEFKKLIEKEGIDPSLGEVDLVLDSRYCLELKTLSAEAQFQPVDTKVQAAEKCIGGVVLTNDDGLIVCKNTLDSRLQLAYQQMLPDIRRELF